MRLRLIIAAIAALATLVVAPAAQAAKPGGDAIAGQLQRSAPITGTAPDGGRFVGKFKTRGFAVRDGKLVAVGTLVGRLFEADGDSRKVSRTNVEMPATLSQTAPGAKQAGGSCTILYLTLGPLDLNLLGLRVQLNQVVLRITAVRGPGNLLGNLLCAVAGLLNPVQGRASG